MTLGQPRQEDLLEYVFNCLSEEEKQDLKSLFIDLSPWNKRRK